MEGALWGNCRLVRHLAQVSSILWFRGMDTRSGRDTESEKALAKNRWWSARATCPQPITQAPRLQLGEGSLTLQHFAAICGKEVSHSAWKQDGIHLVGRPRGEGESGGDLILTSGVSSKKTSSSGREGSRADTMQVSGTFCSQSMGLLWGPSVGYSTAASFQVRNLEAETLQ